MEITLGKVYKDRITNWQGVAVARTAYLSGCIHVELERAGKDGKPESSWFDEYRVAPVLRAKSFADSGPPRSPGRRPPERSRAPAR